MCNLLGTCEFRDDNFIMSTDTVGFYNNHVALTSLISGKNDILYVEESGNLLPTYISNFLSNNIINLL